MRHMLIQIKFFVTPSLRNWIVNNGVPQVKALESAGHYSGIICVAFRCRAYILIAGRHNVSVWHRPPRNGVMRPYYHLYPK